jgi:hypothetical protein
MPPIVRASPPAAPDPAGAPGTATLVRMPMSVPRPGGLRHAGRMSRYAAARIYALPESFDELVGPVSGTVTLPLSRAR